MPPTRKSRRSASRSHLSLVPSRRYCGLCSKRDGLTPAECGQPWIYDDARTDELFSDARNSCGHNPGRLMRCGVHDPQRHRGAWKTCTPCRDALAAENDVELGPHKTPVERLENPPAVELTRCSVCHPCIRLDKDRDRRRASHDVGWSSGDGERPKG